MKIHLSKELKAGLIVLILAISMYWLVNFLKGRDIFDQFSTYHAIYENVEGISLTGPVYIRGFKVGTVDRITYSQEKNHFDVRLKLNANYNIPANSVAEIYSTDILGGTAIRINMGNTTDFLESKDSIQTMMSKDFMGVIFDELAPLKKQVANVLTGLDSALTQVNKVLNIKNQANLELALADFQATMQHLKSLSSYLDTETPQIHSILSNLNQLAAELGSSSGDIKTTLSNLSTFSDSLTQADIASTINNLDSLLARLQSSDGSLGKLMNDDAVYTKVNQLLGNLDSLVKNINNNPKKYLKISVF